MKKWITVFILLLCFSYKSYGADFGYFVGQVKTEWLDDGRKMKLLENYLFIDGKGVRWEAPKGWIVDGASIPQFAWTPIGGPYEGTYRNASVIHDVACDKKERRWEDVHDAFYNAMRASGVDDKLAKIMFGAVYHFGPRWVVKVNAKSASGEVKSKISAIKKEFPANSSFDISVSDYYETSYGFFGETKVKTDLQDINITVTPPPYAMSQNDFDKLKTNINDNDITIDQIKQYLPSTN